jgi:endoglucanase
MSVFAIGVLSAAASVCAQPALTGINLAGAEFNGKDLPGVFGKTYIYPSPDEIGYFLDKGMNVIRLPFRWERVEPNLGGDLDEAELARIDAVVAYATGRGASVILDLHNYARYRGELVGSAAVPAEALARVWTALAQRYRANERVIFGLMNEPHGLPAEGWREIASTALAAIRGTGARNLVLVPGVAWTGAIRWLKPRSYGTPNSVALQSLTDPGNNMAFELHQYFDKDWSGSNGKCPNDAAGLKALADVTDWLRRTGHRAFLGEFAVGQDEQCLALLEAVLRGMRDASDVWIGWTYWAGGRWWKPKYHFNVAPIDGKERPQMEVLQRFLVGGAPRAR